MSNDLSNPIFHDAYKARQWLETRSWPYGTICPHCRSVGQATLLQNKTARPGLYMCKVCRKPFTVTPGTLYERSQIPLNKWLTATFLIVSSKNGISASQIGRMIGVSLATSLFLCHRIRESLGIQQFPRFAAAISPIGRGNKFVEIDKTDVGGKEKNKHAINV